MCGSIFGGGKKPVQNIVASPNDVPEKAPDPVAISSDARDKKRAGRNSLRIDLAAGNGPKSGVNV